MTIKLGMPYMIAPLRVKRYAAHYNIPPEKCLIVPTRLLGNEVACDIRWESDNGELMLLENKLFVCDNLVKFNPLLQPQLQELWEHYYNSGAPAPMPRDPETN